ncbi:radical SAM protein [uncultured Eubacterium sp.]|uniref:radical SAM protein n=1 Tax=uncultured Eubacterium sp. TaxID=165185 RepID=UPI002673A526|nr:radical SAM protein [uncultured Eubacterium sp.]
MYKPSKYNNKVIDNEELVIVNSLYGSRIKFTDIDNINIANAILSGKIHKKQCENEVFQFLKENKMIVNEEIDENVYARLVKTDVVSNSRLQLIILPTEQCNFRCKYCYESFGRGKMAKETQDAIIKYISRNISRYSGLDISWFGGEPLLAKDVIEYMSEKIDAICKKAKKMYTTTITTNAYCLDFETFRMLQKYNLVAVQVTLDGIKETHDKQRVFANGEPTYDVIINNLIEIKNKAKSGVQKIILRTNVSKDIFDKMDEYIDFYSKTFGDDSRFSFFIRPVGDWGGEAVEQMKSKMMDSNSFRSVYNKIIKSDTKLNMNFFERFLVQGGCVCYAGKRNAYVIKSNGDIGKCTCELDSEDNKIGKMLVSGDMDIDEFKLAKWIDISNYEKCSECSFYGFCVAMNCPLRGKATDDEHVCPYEKEYFSETIKLMNSIGLIAPYESKVAI